MEEPTTSTLDLSQVYLDWAKDNFRANELDPDDHYFCKGDTFHWLKRLAREGRTFDGIILDPRDFAKMVRQGTPDCQVTPCPCPQNTPARII